MSHRGLVKTLVLSTAVVAILVSNGIAQQATVEVFCEYSSPSSEAVAAGAPDGGRILDFFATTNADILSIGRVEAVLNGDLFNVDPPFGSNTMPPDPAFIELNPALEADSWVTTPGTTNQLGADLPGDGNTTFGDLTNDGPQDMFHFARFTMPARTFGRFSGVVTVAGANGPESFSFIGPFGPCFPEPTSLTLASLCVIGVVARRTQHQKVRLDRRTRCQK